MNMEPILEVRDLYKHFPDITAVDGISFEVFPGESIGIVGESGCGKSTTVRMITGLEPISSGSILYKGKPYQLKAGKSKNRINMVFQDPVTSFDRKSTVFNSLYEALSHTKSLNKKDADALIEQAIETVELSKEYKTKRISQLSGGECQRIAIARVMLTEPELVIFDEATSALDVSVQAKLLNLLSDLKEKEHYTYIFVSHDLALVSSVCTRIIVMYRGKILETGNVRDVIQKPLHPYTKLLLSCGDAFAVDENGNTSQLPQIPQPNSQIHAQCPFYSFCQDRSDECIDKAAVLQELEKKHWSACCRK